MIIAAQFFIFKGNEASKANALHFVNRSVANEMGRLELRFPHLLQGYLRLMELIKGKKLLICAVKRMRISKSHD